MRFDARKISMARRTYGAANVSAARVIAATPERFGGERGALVTWARMVLASQHVTRMAPTAATRA